MKALRDLVLPLSFTVLFVLPTVLGAQSSAGSAEPVLRPGDTVVITVWRKPELSGEFTVSSTGQVGDPFYAAVRVTDVPLTVAETRVRDHVAQIEANPLVWVEPLFRVTVGGEVRQPSLYSLRRETTLSQAVASAGGATERGMLERVRLIRDGEQFLIDLTDPAERLAHIPIRSGDQILIDRRRNLFREVIAPSASVVAATGTLLNIMLRYLVN